MIQGAMRDNVDAQVLRLDCFGRLLERMFGVAIVEEERSLPKMLLLASLLRARQTAKAVELIAQAGCVEEIQAMSRTLVEVTVNASYLQYTGSRELQRYLGFHPERIHSRALTDGGTARLTQRLSGILARIGAPTQKANGAGWSAKSLLERAQMADNASGIPVMTHLVQRCYSKGHAASTGTIASLDTFLSAVSSMELPAVENRLAALAEALFAINLCLLTFCLYLNEALRLGLDREIDEAANAETAPGEAEPKWESLVDGR